MSRLLPNARILALADVYRLLGRQTADDAIRAGWLKPRCLKHVPRGPQRRLFSLSDVQDVEDRILAGQYPGQVPEPAAPNFLLHRKPQTKAKPTNIQ